VSYAQKESEHVLADGPSPSQYTHDRAQPTASWGPAGVFYSCKIRLPTPIPESVRASEISKITITTKFPMKVT